MYRLKEIYKGDDVNQGSYSLSASL
jgi:hypothetical protein